MLYAVVTYVLLPDGRVLGVSRKDDPTDFGVPGGKFESEDGIWVDPQHRRAAAVRELYEETGANLSAEVLSELGVRMDDEFQVQAYVYRGDVTFTQVPGEGVVDRVTWDVLFRGSFGDYNRWGYRQLMGQGWISAPE